MTTNAAGRPVALEELRRAWLAVQAGDFRHPPEGRPAPLMPASTGAAG